MDTFKISIILSFFIIFLKVNESVNAQYCIKQSVLGNGGTSSSNNSHRLSGTIGQPGIGLISSPSNIHKAGFWYQSGGSFIGIEAISNSLPGAFQLLQNYPNPFNPMTTIQYELSSATYVRLVVFDLLGRRTRTLVDRLQAAGHFQILWDGRDDQNIPAAAGIYFCKMDAGEYMKVIKLVLLR